MESDSEIVARLEALDSCILSDALDRLGIGGVAPGLRRLTGSAGVTAPVRTVRLEPDDGRPRTRHLGTEALASLPRGAALVVANGGRTGAAAWGGLLTRAARARGAVGVLVDGAARDLDEIADLGVPLFARSAVPMSARGRWVEVGSGGPVQVAGVTVEPGDFVRADGSGVVFLPRARTREVLEVAEELAARETWMAARLDAGEAPSSVLGREYEELTDAGG